MNGTEMIAQERQRQITAEGWTPEHDRQHIRCELVQAARAYAFAALCRVRYTTPSEDLAVPNDWPLKWSQEWWKPSDDPVRNLVKAGALIAAEIDRLQRRIKTEDRPAKCTSTNRNGGYASCVKPAGHLGNHEDSCKCWWR
jgi:hypothetical protein